MSYAALPVLRTPRLTLRPLTEQDADDLVKGIDNFDVSKWLAVVPYPYDRGDALDFIAAVHAQNKPFWAICDASALVGIVSLDDELAYWLARRAWGKGYGFEAARAAVSHWFSDPGAGDLQSGYFEGNARSGALLRALGFVFDEKRVRYARSFQQDVVSNRMRLTRAAWEARQTFSLTTERLVIRPLSPEDAAGLADMTRPELARQTGSLDEGMSEEAARDWIAARLWRGRPGFQLGVYKDTRLVGILGLGGAPVSIMYAVHPDHWRQGIATEALSAFLPEVFDRFPLSRVVADVFEDNVASRRIMDRFGFVETGRGTGLSKARLEPAPLINYALTRDRQRVPL